MTVALQPVTDALVSRLSDIASVPVHVGARGDDVPALVVHQVDGGGGFLRDLNASHSTGSFAWQVTCVAATSDHAQSMRDAVVALVTESPPDGVKLAVCVSQGTLRPDRDVTPAVWVATPLFHLTV